MNGISLPMWEGTVPVTLSNLVTSIGVGRVRNTRWELRGVDSAGDPAAAREVNELSDGGSSVPGDTLIDLAARGVQIIDGEVLGYQPDEIRPWIVIRAVDSSWWDVESDDQALLALLRAIYPRAASLPR